MQRKASSLEEKVEEIYDYQKELDKVGKKLTDLEDRSRRKNLQVDGTAAETYERQDNCKQKMKEIFMDNLELNTDITERAHIAKERSIIKNS